MNKALFGSIVNGYRFRLSVAITKMVLVEIPLIIESLARSLFVCNVSIELVTFGSRLPYSIEVIIFLSKPIRFPNFLDPVDNFFQLQ